MTIAQKLIDVNQAKQDIKTAIEAKGVSMTGVTFPDYHTKIAQITGGGGGGPTPPYTPTGDALKTYTRNPEFMPVPAPVANQIKILCWVADMSYMTAMVKMTVTGGNYSIDWGDGQTNPTVISGTTITKNLNYSGCDPATTMSDGARQCIITITADPGAVITAFYADMPPYFAQIYYAYEYPYLEMYFNTPNCNEFYIGGGQATRRMSKLKYIEILEWGPTPYRRQMFNYLINVEKIKLPTTVETAYVTYWQDAQEMFSNCFNLIEIENLDTTPSLDCQGMFLNCRSLQSIKNAVIPTASVTKNFAYMFQGCASLVELPADWYTTGIDARNVNSTSAMTTMFSDCQSITEIPDIIFSHLINNLSQMFRNCYSLIKAPTMTFPNGNNVATISQIFENCSSLKELTLEIPNVTTMDYCNRYNRSLIYADYIGGSKLNSMEYSFQSCESLEQVPQNLDTSSCDQFRYAFYACYALTNGSSPNFKFDRSGPNARANTVQGDFYGMFRDCWSLEIAPDMSTLEGGYDMRYMFYLCYALQKIPSIRLNSPSGALVQRMAYGCESAYEIGTINFTQTGTGTVTTLNDCFDNLYQVRKHDITLAPFSVAGLNKCTLSSAELDKLYTNLPTTATPYTLTVSNNPGYSGSNTSIATAKGWTVN